MVFAAFHVVLWATFHHFNLMSSSWVWCLASSTVSHTTTLMRNPDQKIAKPLSNQQKPTSNPKEQGTQWSPGPIKFYNKTSPGHGIYKNWNRHNLLKIYFENVITLEVRNCYRIQTANAKNMLKYKWNKISKKWMLRIKVIGIHK